MNTNTLKLLGIIIVGAIINFGSSFKNQELITKNNIYAVVTLTALIESLFVIIIMSLKVGPNKLINEITKLNTKTVKEIILLSIASIVSTLIWLYLLTNTQFVRLKILDYIIDVGITLLGTAMLVSGQITPQKIIGAILLIIAVVIMEHDKK